MAPTKTCKKNNLSYQNKKITTTEPTPTPWPDLPQRLLNLISRQPTLMHQISFNGINKSWQPAAKTCPSVSIIRSLIITNDKSDTELNTFAISFRTGYQWHPRWLPEFQETFNLIGFYQGKLIIRDLLTSASYTLNPPESYGFLPNLDPNIPIKSASLYSPSNNPRGFVAIVLTGISRPAFLRYTRIPTLSLAEHQWTKHDSTLIDPNDPGGGHMRFSNGVWFQNKFYGLSLQGTLAVIEDLDSRLVVTRLGSGRAVPSVTAKHFREYLLESDGEILLVFLISRKSKRTVDDVEVYRLGFTRLSWRKVERLGDKALFLGGDCCMIVDSRQVGCKPNCVYFRHDADEHCNWDVYDMGDCRVDPGWIESDPIGIDSFWYVV